MSLVTDLLNAIQVNARKAALAATPEEARAWAESARTLGRVAVDLNLHELDLEVSEFQ